MTDLARPRNVVRARLEERIDIGREALLNEPIQSPSDYRRVSQDLARWRKFNQELLKSLFTDDEPAEEFGRQLHFVFGGIPQPLDQQIEELHRDIETLINRLEGILERATEIYQEAPGIAAPPQPESGDTDDAKAVFIVHGRGQYEDKVARAIEGMGATAIILQEQLHQGSTPLLTKIGREAEKCGYAVVIYTGDDVGCIRGEEPAGLTPRARENVVLELGFFLGRLGPDKVSVLHDPAVAFPSDFGGIGYYALDPAGAWKTRIEGELRLAGLIT
jgi:predicted nucleotide-binding protein